MIKHLLFFLIILCSTPSFATEVKFSEATAKGIEVDYLSRLYVTFSKKVVRYKLSGEVDKEYKLAAKDSLIKAFLMPNMEVLLVTKNPKFLYVIDENFKLIDSVDTKKKAGFSPQQLLSVAKDEFAVINTAGNKISTYSYAFEWKAEINYNMSGLGKSWYFVNGFGGGYRYFYSEESKGIFRTDNNGASRGFIPTGSGLREFYVFIKDQQEKAYVYLGGSFVEASFDNINDVRVKASISHDNELTAILLNEVAVKLYNDKFVVLNVQPNF
ncbi:MAG: hypothetical protein JNL75_00515 [Chitinophagales bacterium]|nr:hypothetical protein [Chitinophagales bacterium]